MENANMIKAIIFDLDGVLVDADRLHFDALNLALETNAAETISWEEHLTIYKGIPTAKKLPVLTERKGLSTDLYTKIRQDKQKYTLDLIDKLCKPDPEKIEMLKLLSKKYPIYVCSNAVRNSVELMLKHSGLYPFIKLALSNEDVLNPKPSPDMYTIMMGIAGLQPDECLIVEDSNVGYEAAIASKAIVCKVNGPEEVNYYRILKSILWADTPNVVIPAAGQGKRFAEANYHFPKPLIPINDKPMLNLVLQNFKDIGRNIVLMQKHDIDKYCARDILPSTYIVSVKGLTQGAACTVLLAEHLINNKNELIIANSDQYLDEPNIILEFLQEMRRKNADGGMLTFNSTNPKWSYAKCISGSLVHKVAEKEVISEHATVGIYYYKHGEDFVKYADQMIRKNIRTNNEFYVCPIFNEFIADGKYIYIHEIAKDIMHGLGTPEDLSRFLNWKAQNNV